MIANQDHSNAQGADHSRDMFQQCEVPDQKEVLLNLSSVHPDFSAFGPGSYAEELPISKVTTYPGFSGTTLIVLAAPIALRVVLV